MKGGEQTMNKQKTIDLVEGLEKAGLPVGYILGEIDKAIGRGNDIVRVGISINEVDFCKTVPQRADAPIFMGK